MNSQKLAAELIGTFWLTFGGCGSAVLAAAYPDIGIGLLGVSLAFGLTVLTMAYSIGHISGCHLNPAVTVGLAVGGRFPGSEVLPYIAAQVVGAILGALVLYIIASGAPGFDASVSGLASNGYGEHSPGGLLAVCRLLVRGRADHDVPLRYYGCDTWSSARGVCSHCNRVRTDADTSHQYPSYEYVSKPRTQYWPRALCRQLGTKPTLAVLGCAFDRWGIGRPIVQVDQSRAE